MEKKHKVFKIVLLIAVITVFIANSFFLSHIRSYLNQKINKVLIEEIYENALSANIMIIQSNYKRETNAISTSYSASSSGVIFHKEGNKYYALTAEHNVIEDEDVEKTRLLIIGYNEINYPDYITKVGNFQPISDYYTQFPEAQVEYLNYKYDLAIISFISDEDYKVLPITDKTLNKGDLVVSMSNTHKKRNLITAGRIKDKKLTSFKDDNETQYSTIIHTALTSVGSSGSALLNKDLEIVGINIGGNENIFRKFISGIAIPSNQIHDFLKEWDNNFLN